MVLREQERTLLMHATKREGEEMVRLLLVAKTDVNLMAGVICISTFRVVSEEL